MSSEEDLSRRGSALQRLQEGLRVLVGGAGDLGAVLRAAALVLCIRVAASLLNYVLIVALARWMGAAEFGIYAYALSWSLLLAVPTGLGIHGMCLRYVAQYRAGSDLARLRGLLARSVQIVSGTGMTVALVGLTFLLVLRATDLDSRTTAVALAIAGVPVMALSVLASQLGRAFGWMAAAFAPPQVGQALFALSVAAAVFVSGSRLTAPFMVAVALAGFALMIALQAGIYVHRLRPSLGGVQPRFETRMWLRVALPLVLFEGFAGIIAHSDMIMVGLLLRPEDIGHYQAAVRTAMLATFIPQSMMSLAGPKIASMHEQGTREQLQAFLSSVVPWIVLPTLALSIALAVLAGPLLGLFGADFHAGFAALVLLVAGTFLASCFGPAPIILNMTGHQDDCARVYAAAALANVVLNAALIPSLGIAGAALATAAALATSHGWLALLVRRRLGVASWFSPSSA